MKPKGNKMKVQNKGGFSKQKNSKKLQSRNTVQIICYNCNKPKHLARNCRNRNRPVAQTNLIEEDLVAMISEINMIRGF